MPIYEYLCGNCGHQLEVMQKIIESALTLCPECHTEKLAKQISNTSFQLKGSGYYATDFKDKPKPTGAAATQAETKEPPKVAETAAPTAAVANPKPSTE